MLRPVFGPALAGFLLVAGAASAQATPKAQFDLVCKGWQHTAAAAPKRAYEVRYSLDLTAMKWCAKGCGSIRDVTPGEYRLSEMADGKRGRLLTVDRRTGKLVDLYSDGDVFDEREASCEPAPFTPFPATKF